MKDPALCGNDSDCDLPRGCTGPHYCDGKPLDCMACDNKGCAECDPQPPVGDAAMFANGRPSGLAPTDSPSRVLRDVTGEQT